MSTDIQNGTMMIREGFLLPESAQIESRSYSNTWRILTGLDNFSLDRRLRAAGWHLFFIAGELKVIELGWGASAVRRGMKRILCKGGQSNLNCVQITQARRARFSGLPYFAIRAYSFHIQKDAVLESNTERKSEQQDRDWACG